MYQTGMTTENNKLLKCQVGAKIRSIADSTSSWVCVLSDAKHVAPLLFSALLATEIKKRKAETFSKFCWHSILKIEHP